MVYVDTQHQTGGESWGVRRGGRHGKGDCQIRRNHRYQTSVTQKFVFQKEVMLSLSSGSSEKQGGVGQREAEAARWHHSRGRKKAQPTHGGPSARTKCVDVWTAMRGHVVWVGRVRVCVYVLCPWEPPPTLRLFRGGAADARSRR